jgi:hypothetical protein
MNSLFSLALNTVGKLNYDRERETFLHRWVQLPVYIPDAENFGERYCDPACHCTYQPTLFQYSPTGHMRHLKWLTWKIPIYAKWWKKRRGKKSPISLSLLCYNYVIISIVKAYKKDLALTAVIPEHAVDRYFKILMHKIVTDGLVSTFSEKLPIELFLNCRNNIVDNIITYGKIVIEIRKHYLHPFEMPKYDCPYCTKKMSRLTSMEDHIFGQHLTLSVHSLTLSKYGKKLVNLSKIYNEEEGLELKIKTLASETRGENGIKICTVHTHEKQNDFYYCCQCLNPCYTRLGLILHTRKTHVVLKILMAKCVFTSLA